MCPAMAEFKKERDEEEKMNEKLGRPGDVDFQRMIDRFRVEERSTAQAVGLF
jgi:hypothetical protein